MNFAEARLREGFVAPELKLAVIPYSRLVHRRRQAAAPAQARQRIAAAIELRVGDLVVHEDHGVARFSGFDTKTLAGITRDYLELEYKGGDKVFAPTDQLAKISRYVGADGSEAQLSALGGKRWLNLKARARRAAQEMAGELLNLYAERLVRRGHPFSPDGELQLGFEAAFPYRETADQMEAIDAVKADMEGERPMDRLICGDVGYGKTEVALRAAHKAAVDGKQVMMLVPTTILAQQHFGSFRERFADTPFNVEMVSRLRRPAEVKEVLKRYSEGKVDVLLGTHRLLSRDVRAKDLGLLIVDEEQRFGVKQKELLRQLKLKVDVLAMSATPIPRTLQMSLAGLRDISVIETPPEGRRPVRTFVGPYDDDLVTRAIEREAERGGQSFFLHNLIETLPGTTERLRALCPGVRFAEAHGQMDELELEATMLAFVRGEHDCLVTTTIIESGLDIPTANTLIVERADQLGLSQAYQIRGRVGRSRERAYAYMLYPSPEALTADAAARLSTLSDNTELGSGFRVAMRDLEIRGAGNLLGDEQSGHVAAVGFELYCQMLEDAAEEMRAGAEERAADEREPVRVDVDVDAYVPADYIPFEAAKIDVHRRSRGRPRARRAARPARRARGSLRAGARAGRQPARAAAGSDRAGRGRRPHRRVPGRAACAPRRSSSTPRRRPSCASGCPRRSTSGASRPWWCRSPTRRRRGSGRCWRWPTGSPAWAAPRRRVRGRLSAGLGVWLCCRPCAQVEREQEDDRDRPRRRAGAAGRADRSHQRLRRRQPIRRRGRRRRRRADHAGGLRSRPGPGGRPSGRGAELPGAEPRRPAVRDAARRGPERHPRPGLDRGRGRGAGRRGLRPRGRGGVQDHQGAELQDREGVRGLPQAVLLHPGGRRPARQAAGDQHQDPGGASPPTPPTSPRRTPGSSTRPTRSSSRSPRRATSASSSTRTPRRRRRPSTSWSRTTPPRTGRRSPPSSPPTPPRRTPAACASRSPRASSPRPLTRRSSTPPRARSVGPIETDAGTYVFQVDSITEATTTPFEEAQAPDRRAARGPDPAGEVQRLPQRLSRPLGRS